MAHRGLWTTSQREWKERTHELTTTNRHVILQTSFSHHNFEILLTFGKVNASVTSRKVNPIVSMNKEKIGLKVSVFPQKQKPIGEIGPLTQKDLIWREFGPLTVAKVQKGVFHGCQRLSKSRLRAMTAIR